MEHVHLIMHCEHLMVQHEHVVSHYALWTFYDAVSTLHPISDYEHSMVIHVHLFMHHFH